MMYLSSRDFKQVVFHFNRSELGDEGVYPLLIQFMADNEIAHDPGYRTPAEMQMLSDILVWASETQCNCDSTTPSMSVFCFNINTEYLLIDSSWNFTNSMESFNVES